MTGLSQLPGEEQRPRNQAIQPQAPVGHTEPERHTRAYPGFCAECVPKRGGAGGYGADQRMFARGL